MSRAQTAKLEEGPASKTSAADRGATSPAQRLTIRGYSDSGDVVTMGSGAGGVGALGGVAALIMVQAKGAFKVQGGSTVQGAGSRRNTRARLHVSCARRAGGAAAALLMVCF